MCTPLGVKWGWTGQGEKVTGDKSAWVFKTSDVQQVVLNAALLTPTLFFPGSAAFPGIVFLLMWLHDKPDYEADPAEK